MEACQIPSEDILIPSVVELEIDDPQCDFECVKKAATTEAHSYDCTSKLVSWFDRKRETFFSPGGSCVKGMPSWVEYGAMQGADLTIDVNHEDYVFMFSTS